MMKAFSLYDASTGLFSGHSLSTSIDSSSSRMLEEYFKANTPAGYEVIEGRHDYLSRRVDIDHVQRDRAAALAQHERAQDEARRTFVPCIPGGGEFREQPFVFRAGPEHVVDYQPPQPSADHEWNATTKRWQLSQAAQERQAKCEAALARIASLRDSQHDYVRAMVLNPANAEARKELQAIEAEIAGLRDQIGAR